MPTEQRNMDVMATWTRELNETVRSSGIVFAGVDAASILPSGFTSAPFDAFQALTDDDLAAIASNANAFWETDRIGAEQIRDAVRATLWHWSNPDQ